jgi:3-oxoadipate enol-lactonase
MQIANSDHIGLHWREDGNATGRPVVFSNSLGTDLRVWDKVVPLLPQQLRYIRYDKRGHGLSHCPRSPYAMDDLVEDTAALLAHLGVDKCVFVGLSIGGMIGQALASQHPNLIHALVLSNTAAKMGDTEMWLQRIAAIEKGGIEALADPILERWFSTEFRAKPELSAWRNMLTRTPTEGYLGCCHAIAETDLSDKTSELALPVLAIAGSQDQASSPSLVKKTADIIPNAKYSLIDGAGHLPCVEKPEAFATLLTEFFEEIEYV